MKPVTIIQKADSLSKGAKCANGKTALDFSFELTPDSGKVAAIYSLMPVRPTVTGVCVLQLQETYHGVYINIQYTLDVNLKMGMMQQDVKKSIEFIVEIPVPSLSL